MNGDPRIPAPELMLTIELPGRIRLAAALHPWNAEVRLSSNCERKISSGVSISVRVVFSSDPPTLFTQMSRRPNSLHRLVRQRLGQVADVTGDDERLPAALVDACGGDLEVGHPSSVQHDVTTGVGEAPGDRPADALARAGDHGDPAGQIESVEQVHGRNDRTTSQSSTARGRNCPVLAVIPPSTGTTAPFTNEASADVRNSITAAISSACPQRCSGMRRRRSS